MHSTHYLVVILLIGMALSNAKPGLPRAERIDALQKTLKVPTDMQNANTQEDMQV